MAVKWTDKQEKVIETRGRNLLVSAAAGSGKTAVLVERIIQKILDKDNPIDVDKLLVVTFTKAAAAEMRERVLEALEKALEADPSNDHLQRQQTYIHNAKITTIDSFCAQIVREHFDRIKLDPNTRIVDEAQIKMLEQDVLSDMLEEYFEKGDKDYLMLADSYTDPKKTGTLEELISKLYHAAMSHVNPKIWLEECKLSYKIDSVEEMENTKWMRKLKELISSDLDMIENKANQALEMCKEDVAFEKYYTDINDLKNGVLKVDINADYETIREGMLNIDIPRMPTVKTGDDVLREHIKAIRNSIKDKINDIKSMLSQPAIEVYNDIAYSSKNVDMLIDLTLDFSERFSNAKYEKCIMDFSDQEHYAMNILIDFDEDGSYSPSQVAKDMAVQFEEIMIDEYQDSNYIQETILTSIANGFGVNNVFMVGDVKQSIYKFRLANPNLFIEKYNSYSEDLTKPYSKIILDKNFRSRNEIIDSVNYIFERIMHRDLGGIEYEDGNALSFGADYYPPLPKGQDNRTEFLLVEGKGNENEALTVARRIKELVNPDNGFAITDKNGSFRTPKYSDIVILLRSVKGRADEYVKILSSEGVPAYCESKVGYYEAKEVRTMVDYLSVIDNPLQDIPLASVLRSEMYDITSEELASIKVQNLAYYFYDNIKLYMENGDNEVIKTKLSKFMADLDKYRNMVSYTNVYDLITLILSDTGYLRYISALPNGVRRVKNIEILKEKAVNYDTGTYKGLFNFVRYIEKIKDLGIEEGEASPVSENDNIVRIMTFHKSKGLQFPIVFVSGLGTKFNNSELRETMAIHESFGIGVDYINDALKVKTPTLIKNVIKEIIKEENYAEYIRFLYVALTRAQEKMIMTASDSDMEGKIEKFLDFRNNLDRDVSYSSMMGSNSFLDWIGRAYAGNKGFDKVAELFNSVPKVLHPSYRQDSSIISKYVSEDEIEFEEIADITDKKLTKELLLNWDTDIVYDQDRKEKLSECFEWKYGHSDDSKIPAKLSVTEIKKLSMHYDEDSTYLVDDKNEKGDVRTNVASGADAGGKVSLLKQDLSNNKISERHFDLPEIIPEFLSEKDKDEIMLTGANRGTAYHRIFELFDFAMEPTKENIENMILNLIKCGKISKEGAACVAVSDLLNFTKTELYSRMKRAYENHTLYRERSFMMGIPASELKIFANTESDEVILVQGIIDVCFIEDGKFIIADYKTDNLSCMQDFVDAYATQLDSYKDAIEKIDDIKVSEKIIYSVKFGKQIYC